MKYSIIAASIILLVVLPARCGISGPWKGEKQVVEQDVMDLMKKLDTIDERNRMRLLSRVDEQRNELLGVLLKHLGTSSSKNVQAAAIYLIGRNRLSEGVTELIRRIDFAPGSEQRIPEPEPLWEKYPAMEALITIGKPSVAPAIELLATDAMDLRRTLAAKVIRYVEGSEVSMFILERAITNEKDDNRKALLTDGLSRLKRLIRETS